MLNCLVTDSSSIRVRTQQRLIDTPDWLQSVPTKTQGEIEAAISEGISRFGQDYMPPKDIQVHLLSDLPVVRIQGVLAAAEQDWSNRFPPKTGGICSSERGPI